ncbi:MAG: hypothetical protein DI629_00410 [Mesorhizobium amorphae]|nr:MAG: hypothetical protein DI629_00410 [Mesorhizobium amorphae]
MTSTALIRPAWTPTTIALTVVGFMVFWPLGLAMIAYIVWGDRFHGVSRDFKAGNWKGAWNCGRGRGRRNSFRAFDATGNVAFDDWRDKELARLDEERQKLDAMRDDFDAYARELRRAKDQEEFDRFMRDRSASKPDVDGKADQNRPNGDNLLNG